MSDSNITWEEARRVSLLKNRTDDYPLGVENVEETGVLEDSLTLFDSPEVKAEVGKEGAGRRFAEHINRKLAESRRKDIYIYVHGYKVIFENPVLVATELWHFLGYEGAFIAYFRKSPWVSSDILMSLMYDLSPEERGLVRGEREFAWRFPADYISRLRSSLAKRLPKFKRNQVPPGAPR